MKRCESTKNIKMNEIKTSEIRKENTEESFNSNNAEKYKVNNKTIKQISVTISPIFLFLLN